VTQVGRRGVLVGIPGLVAGGLAAPSPTADTKAIEEAVLAAEGESTATTTAGQAFTTPFAQTVVFVLRDGAWKAIHAHQSAPRR
jgi:hypothetical protein